MNNLEESNKDEIINETDQMENELEQDLTTAEGMPRQEPEETEDEPKKKDTLREVLEWVRFTVIAILLALLFTNYVLQRNTVQGDSMYPTLLNGDELFVEKVSRYFGGINRGDIITVDTHGLDKYNPNNIIKRVVGLPGEHVEIKDGRVYINGELLDEPYLREGVVTVGDVRNPENMDVILEENEYYCLGDNRPNSKDSRVFGPVPRQNILGHTIIRVYPFDRFGTP